MTIINLADWRESRQAAEHARIVGAMVDAFHSRTFDVCAPPVGACVYFLVDRSRRSSDGRGLYKVGQTRNFRRRLTELRAVVPWTPLGFMDCGDDIAEAKDLERDILWERLLDEPRAGRSREMLWLLPETASALLTQEIR